MRIKLGSWELEVRVERRRSAAARPRREKTKPDILASFEMLPIDDAWALAERQMIAESNAWSSKWKVILDALKRREKDAA